MKIITTPMCEDILKMANIPEYTVVKPNEIRDADVAVLLSETNSSIPKIAVKLNTYTQIKDAVYTLRDRFNTQVDEKKIDEINKYICDNNEKKDKRGNTKVKVYSKFLLDTIIDMGFTVTDYNYDYVVVADFMKDKIDEDTDNIVTVPSHSNVSRDILERISKRYELLENQLCMKQ